MIQNYIAPDITILEVEPAKMFAVSSIEYTSETASKDYNALSNGRRESWGNLWE